MGKLWFGFTAVVVVSFVLLGIVGAQIYQAAPPIPERVVTTGGAVVIEEGAITKGQNVWQSLGGMEVGSVWGHGSYVAPDWTADWLHRESMFLLDRWAESEGHASYHAAPTAVQAALRDRLAGEMRTNTYDERSRTLTVSRDRADAFEANVAHYTDVFARGRDAYAIPAGALTDRARAREMASFFFWSSWAASTNRPNAAITYTSNWPHEPLVRNVPSGETVVWTGVSVLALLAGIGAMAWWHASRPRERATGEVPEDDPMLGVEATPSQRATVKYFWVVSALVLAQMLLGVVTAHYGVEGSGFYGIPLATVLPYVLARTWHVQLGIFWIATAWLGAGLYIGPAVGGHEPKGQRLFVNLLFGALLFVVVGSLAGQWLSVKQRLGHGTAWFYFGHSGYEYIDLGRAFQILLLAGLFFWLFLIWRAIRPALARRREDRTLLVLFLVASAAIAVFYAAALGYGRSTNLAIAEYWRWWVVHLWVEGFFEVFATVVIAFLFARLRLVHPTTAGSAVVLSATIFLSGGIVGTLHHLYFSGTPTSALAFGSVFSALEVVPLLFVGYEAWDNLKLSRSTEWVRNYRWPLYFFVAVAFWNLVGAGLFGFMITPPIALYYLQGLNTTPVHGHTALFGVYGMLGIGLMLFCLRALKPGVPWRTGAVRFSFWSINVGLLLMVVLSVLPVGLLQTWASVEHGYWYARSPEFLGTGLMGTLRWLRVVGDTIFFAGAVGVFLFVAGLATGHSFVGGRRVPTLPLRAARSPASGDPRQG